MRARCEPSILSPENTMPLPPWPRSSGPHPVGTLNFEVTDPTRAALLQPPQADRPGSFELSYERLDGTAPAHPVHRISLRGTQHGDFTDLPMLRDVHDVPAALPMFGGLAAQPLMGSIERAVHDFLARELQGSTNDFPARAAQAFPDILVVHDRRAVLAYERGG
jgi:hypothetical protein